MAFWTALETRGAAAGCHFKGRMNRGTLGHEVMIQISRPRAIFESSPQFFGSVKGLHGKRHGVEGDRQYSCRCELSEESSLSDDRGDEKADQYLPEFEGKQLLMKMQAKLEIAASNEDYEEAARLRDAMTSFRERDPILSRERDLKERIREERYEGAAVLRDELKVLRPKLPLAVPCHSECVTNEIRVSVRSVLLEDRSKPAEGYYFFAYRVSIVNESPHAVQLLNRKWKVTDATGRADTITGPGVVGEQPLIPPGGTFQYTSACPLNTVNGVMEGTYEMLMVTNDENQITFSVKVARFGLDLMNRDVDIDVDEPSSIISEA